MHSFPRCKHLSQKYANCEKRKKKCDLHVERGWRSYSKNENQNTARNNLTFLQFVDYLAIKRQNVMHETELVANASAIMIMKLIMMHSKVVLRLTWNCQLNSVFRRRHRRHYKQSTLYFIVNISKIRKRERERVVWEWEKWKRKKNERKKKTVCIHKIHNTHGRRNNLSFVLWSPKPIRNILNNPHSMLIVPLKKSASCKCMYIIKIVPMLAMNASTWALLVNHRHRCCRCCRHRTHRRRHYLSRQ